MPLGGRKRTGLVDSVGLMSFPSRAPDRERPRVRAGGWLVRVS